MTLGAQCMKQTKLVKRLGKLKHNAYAKAWDDLANEPRWRLEYVVSDLHGKWHTHGRNFNRHETDADPYCERPSEEARQFPLKAKTEAQAKREMRVLDRRLHKEWDQKWEASGVPYNREMHFQNWCRASDELRRMLNALARLRATTAADMNMKAVVIAVVRGDEDDEHYGSP
jgi:hypothetical protein